MRQTARSSGPRTVLCAAAKLRAGVEAEAEVEVEEGVEVGVGVIGAGVGREEEVEEEGEPSEQSVRAKEAIAMVVVEVRRTTSCLPTRRGGSSSRGSSTDRSSTPWFDQRRFGASYGNGRY